MKLISIDTSTFTESVALLEGSRLLGERNVRRAYGHASGLHADIDALLQEADWTARDLDGVVVGIGPGSFTGIRVGMAAAKGLAYALEIPLYGVSSADALLSSIIGVPDALALIDARRGEIYVAGELIHEPRCCAPEALIEDLSARGVRPRVLVGEGAMKHRARWLETWPEVIISESEASHIPRAALLASGLSARVERGEVTPSPIAALEPIYVRPSDAEINYPDGFPSAVRHFS